jgi:hypothetical protein
MPEVVEKELVKVQTTHLAELCGKIDNASGELERSAVPYEFCGYLPGFDEIEKAVTERLDELSPLLQRVPLTLEQTQSALKMVVDHSAPNSKTKEEFRDSIIWQALLQNASGATVHFVSQDKDFYASRQHAKGLHQDLLDTLKEPPLCLKIYPELGQYLATVISTPYPFDADAFLEQLSNWLDDIAPETFAKLGMEDCEFNSITFLPIPGYDNNEITVSFRAVYTGTSPKADLLGIQSATVEYEGAATFIKGTSKLKNAEITGHEEWMIDSAGKRVRSMTVMYVQQEKGEQTT